MTEATPYTLTLLDGERDTFFARDIAVTDEGLIAIEIDGARCLVAAPGTWLSCVASDASGTRPIVARRPDETELDPGYLIEENAIVVASVFTDHPALWVLGCHEARIAYPGQPDEEHLVLDVVPDEEPARRFVAAAFAPDGWRCAHAPFPHNARVAANSIWTDSDAGELLLETEIMAIHGAAEAFGYERTAAGNELTFQDVWDELTEFLDAIDAPVDQVTAGNPALCRHAWADTEEDDMAVAGQLGYLGGAFALAVHTGDIADWIRSDLGRDCVDAARAHAQTHVELWYLNCLQVYGEGADAFALARVRAGAWALERLGARRHLSDPHPQILRTLKNEAERYDTALSRDAQPTGALYAFDSRHQLASHAAAFADIAAGMFLNHEISDYLRMQAQTLREENGKSAAYVTNLVRDLMLWLVREVDGEMTGAEIEALRASYASMVHIDDCKAGLTRFAETMNALRLSATAMAQSAEAFISSAAQARTAAA